jgi:hypothetical protein
MSDMRCLTVGTDTTYFAYDSDGDDVDDSDLMTKIGDDSLSWNANGNLNNSVVASFAYDFDNKLRFASDGDVGVEIRYDPRGNRIYKGISDGDGNIVSSRKYIVDIVGKLPVILCEIDPEIDPNTSSFTNKYYYANSQIIAPNQTPQKATPQPPTQPHKTKHTAYPSTKPPPPQKTSKQQAKTKCPLSRKDKKGQRLLQPFISHYHPTPRVNKIGGITS